MAGTEAVHPAEPATTEAPPRHAYTYSLAHDLFATVRAFVDAYIWPSRVWKQLQRESERRR